MENPFKVFITSRHSTFNLIHNHHIKRSAIIIQFLLTIFFLLTVSNLPLVSINKYVVLKQSSPASIMIMIHLNRMVKILNLFNFLIFFNYNLLLNSLSLNTFFRVRLPWLYLCSLDILCNCYDVM